jgi:hypothetical protein
MLSILAVSKRWVGKTVFGNCMVGLRPIRFLEVLADETSMRTLEKKDLLS